MLLWHICITCPSHFTYIWKRRQWISRGYRSAQQSRNRLYPQILLSVWWDIQVIVNYKLLDNNQIITSNLYCNQFHCLKKAMNKKTPLLGQQRMFGLVLWYINHCRSFNVKSILYISTVLFQTTFNISTQFRCKKTILLQTIKFGINTQFKCQRQFYFKQLQFRISTQFSLIWPIDRIHSDATTPGQSEPGNDGNEGVLCIP